MRVVLLKSKAQQRGGLEKVASRIASAFIEKGAKVSILTTGEAEPLHFHPSISIHSTKLTPWPAFLRFEQFDRFVDSWLKNNPADLVFGMDRNRHQTHIRAGNGVHDAFLKSRIYTEGRLKYLTCLLNPMHRKILQLEKEAFEAPGLKKLFTNSHMVKNEILSRFNTDPAKIEVIHNGVEWSEMGPTFERWIEAKEAHCKTFNLDPTVFHFLFIGNGYLRKGLGQLLEALAKLKNKEFHLSVLGKDNRSEEFRLKAHRLGLQSRVRFFGPRSDILSFYQLADALAIPSFYDPFANVTVEALAMGLFVVSSKTNGGHEILHHENGAIIPDILDVDSLAETLEYAMIHKKSAVSANKIRQMTQPLDYSLQMQRLIEACYE